MDKYTEENNIFIISTLSNFMKYDPPCKNCLVQNMCIKVMDEYGPTYMIVKICDKLKKFLINNKKISLKTDEIERLEKTPT